MPHLFLNRKQANRNKERKETKKNAAPREKVAIDSSYKADGKMNGKLHEKRNIKLLATRKTICKAFKTGPDAK